MSSKINEHYLSLVNILAQVQSQEKILNKVQCTPIELSRINMNLVKLYKDFEEEEKLVGQRVSQNPDPKIHQGLAILTQYDLKLFTRCLSERLSYTIYLIKRVEDSWVPTDTCPLEPLIGIDGILEEVSQSSCPS